MVISAMFGHEALRGARLLLPPSPCVVTAPEFSASWQSIAGAWPATAVRLCVTEIVVTSGGGWAFRRAEE